MIPVRCGSENDIVANVLVTYYLGNVEVFAHRFNQASVDSCANSSSIEPSNNCVAAKHVSGDESRRWLKSFE